MIQNLLLVFSTLFQAPFFAVVRNQFLGFVRRVPEKPFVQLFFVHAEKYPGADGAGQSVSFHVLVPPSAKSLLPLSLFTFQKFLRESK